MEEHLGEISLGEIQGKESNHNYILFKAIKYINIYPHTLKIIRDLLPNVGREPDSEPV